MFSFSLLVLFACLTPERSDSDTGMIAPELSDDDTDMAELDSGDTDTDTDTDADTDADTDTDTDTDTGSAGGDPNFVVGEMLINEFLANSHPVADEVGEWIEILNLTDRDLDLQGLVLGDLDANQPQAVTIDAPVLLPAHGFVVVGNSAAQDQNGGVDVAWAWAAAEFQLGNDGDEIVLSRDGDTYDSVAYEEAAWGMVKGVSVQRDSATLDLSTSNDPAAWCAGTSTFGADLQVGTPNLANDACVR